ncbi:hypothetical protein D1007_35132 [Hordeum vulgare]|nr:hypothetical protein D1007_35132 [Hordeum vulgare]
MHAANAWFMCLLDMDSDASFRSAIVNGETLKMFVGQRVRTVLKVQHTQGGLLVGQSTDGHQLTIRGATEGLMSNYLEVIGIADNDQSITAESSKDFGEDFDADVFNGLCKLVVNGKVKEVVL